MPLILLAIVCGLLGMPWCGRASNYAPPTSPRVEQNLNSGWKFLRQDVPGAELAGFDDSSWGEVNVPHTWNDQDGQNGGSDYYRGPGWYRRLFNISASQAGRRVFLKFDGANLVTEVWLNGGYAGKHQGGYAAFAMDVTPLARFGQDNLLAVRVSNAANTNIPPLSADFTFFGGIYRDVNLIITDPVQITPLDHGSPGVYLQTTAVSSNSAQLRITAVLSNSTAVPQGVTVRAFVVDAGAQVLAEVAGAVALGPAAISNVVLSTTIMNPRLWNGLPDPYLHRVHVEVWRTNALADYLSQPLGFRYFSVDPATGFSLNGQRLPLHGVNLHQDWQDRGWALSSGHRETNFALIREIGANTIRLSHYQHAEHTYQLADEQGLVLWTEIPLVNKITESPEFYENAKQQLRELIRQNYNHPAVFFWGLFNEITLSSGPSPTSLVSQLAQLAKQEDPTRLSTAASAAGDSHASNWDSDIVSFNKYFGWYGGNFSGFGPWADNVHANYPARCVGVSEYGAGASVWHHSEDPVAQPSPGGRFHPEEWQNRFHESHWLQIKSRPFLWATHIWNMFDFGVDGRSEGDTLGRNDKGLATYDRRIKKDAFFWYKANWNPELMVYITGHTFTNRKASPIQAKVYSNCGEVELWVNGTSRGIVVPTNCIATWPVSLQPGSNLVSAIGRSGTVTAQDALIWMLQQEPFRGFPLCIPGRIQAEEFNSGPPEVAFHDADSANTGGAYRTNEAVDIEACLDTGRGYDLTSVAPGEWLNYEVTVASSGYYDLLLRIATPASSASVQFRLDDQTLIPVTPLPYTGGLNAWSTFTITNVPLAKGPHRLRLETASGGFKLNWMHFQFRPAPGATSFKVNFQAAATATPAGYLRDTGSVFTAQSPTAYGWDSDGTAHGRERNSTNSADKRYDTLMHLQRNGSNITWEIAAPNARYLVYAVTGDPDYTDSTHALLAEGVPVLQGAPTTDCRWVEGAAEIEVTDGRMTLSPGPSGSNTKVCFLELAETLPVIALSPASLDAGEFGAATNLACILARTGNTNQPLTVRLFVSGNAVPGLDFLPPPASITLPAGGTSQTLPISILPDDQAEGPETFWLGLTNSPTYWLGSTAAAMVTISDKPLHQWRFSVFGTNCNVAAYAGDSADPDNDGLSNAQEYVLGTNPMVEETNSAWQIRLGEGYLGLTTTRRHACPDATLGAWVAPALTGPWTVIPAQVLDTQDGVDRVLFADPQPMTNSPSRYLKLGFLLE